MKLSDKKTFMANPKPPLSIKASELDSLTLHYLKKHGVIFLKNGGSAVGQFFISAMKEKTRHYYDDLIDRLKDEELKYAEFAKSFFDMPHKLGWERLYAQKANLITLLSFYLTNSSELKRDLTQEAYKRMNTILRTASPQLKDLFDDAIAKYLSDLATEKHEVSAEHSLNHDETWQEILSLQERLEDGQVVGYIYTNGVACSSRHFEVLLISKTEIIKPLSWPHTHWIIFDKYAHKDWSEVHFSFPELIQSEDKYVPSPQATIRGCGTLGLLYLKELLKDNCFQLKNYTLNFSIYTQEKGSTRFFFPSPQVLRYSQSSTYNETLRAMLSDSSESQSLRGGTFKVTTLRRLLEQSIEQAKKEGHTEVVETNSQLLENLNEFRERWLAAYDEMERKRAAMQEQGHNLYLAYATRRLEQYKSEQVLDTTWKQLPSEHSSKAPSRENWASFFLKTTQESSSSTSHETEDYDRLIS